MVSFKHLWPYIHVSLYLLIGLVLAMSPPVSTLVAHPLAPFVTDIGGVDVYVFPFQPNPNWSSFYVGSEEIWGYMKETAIKWDLEKFVSFNSRVNETLWNDDKGKWQVKVGKADGTIKDECDILINASGFLK